MDSKGRNTKNRSYSKIILKESQIDYIISTLKESLFDSLTTLQRGDRGQNVTKLQQYLKLRGYQVGVIDGIFGSKTERALKDFQKDRDIPVTGRISYADLNKLLPKNMSIKSDKNKQDKKDKGGLIKSNNGIIIDRNSNSDNFAIVFGGTPSSKYGANFMYRIGKSYLSDKNVVYSNHENSIGGVVKFLRSKFSNAKVSSLSGFSKGGIRAWEAIGRFPFIGLIDPVVSSFYSNLPSNVEMISRSENWTCCDNIRNNLKKMEKAGVSKKVSSDYYNHNEMPRIFFSKYGNLM